MKGAPLGGDKIFCPQFLKAFDSFRDVHVLVVHEPSGMVGCGGDEGIIDARIFLPGALIMVWSKAKKYSIEDSCFAIATDYEKKIANRRRVINVRDRHGK